MDKMPYYSLDQPQAIQANELEHIQIALSEGNQSMLTERELAIYKYLLETKVFIRFSLSSVGFSV